MVVTEGYKMSEPSGARLVWLDIETTGLNRELDLILEVGVRITTPELELIDDFDVVLWDTPTYDYKYQELEAKATSGDEGAAYVWGMHHSSGLWKACQSEGINVRDAETAVLDFLMGHGVQLEKPPMAGSSVHFDRGFLETHMPLLLKCWGYRNIDVSTIKEVCKLLAPELYTKLDKYGPQKRERHRALPDLEDTAGEFGWYVENFLWAEMEPKA